MRRLAVGLVVFLALPAVVQAQGKDRWRLHWHNEKPKIYTYLHPTGVRENFWYATYDIVNNSSQIAPVILDVELYTEAGKDLQHGVKKVDRATVLKIVEDKGESEKERYGRFYSNVVVPQHIEYQIIEHDARIGNRSQGIIEESIENYKRGDPKGNRFYLNPREMRQTRVIMPGQKLHGIAIFSNVDTLSSVIELHVSGTIDIIRIEDIGEFETVMHYENRVLYIRYEFVGDMYDREADWLVYVKKDWHIKKIGPVASKDTMSKLMDALLGVAKREREWKDSGKTDQEIAALRKKWHITKADTNIMSRVFRLATGKDFGYNENLDVLGNQAAVWRIHEWWTTNHSRLLFNPGLNRFEVKDDKLPGTVGSDK